MKSKLLLALLFASHFAALAVLFVVCAPLAAHAQAVPADIPAVVAPAPAAAEGGAIASFITGLAGSHPWFVTLAAVMGALRLVFKPIVSAIEAYVRSTPTTADDEFVEKVEHSAAFKAFAWGLDFFGSIKLGPQFTAKPKADA
ncbi:MAG: hypothetical protein HZC55_04155 [Verrucomicrobia bacterium]|nr:hypothetical protein [Verrucomicrobiota bacterium]